MIDATQLRLGSLIDHNGIQKIEEISGNRIGYVPKPCERFVTSISPELASPIPITEEILLKLGFIFRPKHGTYELPGFSIEFVPDAWEYCPYQYKAQLNEYGYEILNGRNKARPFVYIHELQNFYYALTGTELDVTNLLK